MRSKIVREGAEKKKTMFFKEVGRGAAGRDLRTKCL